MHSKYVLQWNSSPFLSYEKKQAPWPESASEPYRTSDRACRKVSANFADRGSPAVSATDPHGRILGFLDRSVFRNVAFNIASLCPAAFDSPCMQRLGRFM
jgi:hypothetical protein